MEKKFKKKKILMMIFFLIILVIVIRLLPDMVSSEWDLLEDSYENARKLSANTERKKDTEFINDSKIRITEMNKAQQHNLYVLAKVWGYVKYRHPKITDGTLNWDAELFRVMPRVLAAKSKDKANQAMAAWLEKFPFKIEELDTEEQQEYDRDVKNEYYRTDMSWIEDKGLLGNRLSEYLKRLSKVKKIGEKGYSVYIKKMGPEDFDLINVSMDCETGNDMKYNDSGMRLLSMFRYWNIIEYFDGNKNIIGENWDDVLLKKIPELATGKDHESYSLSMANLTTHIHDTHTQLVDKFRVLDTYLGAYIPSLTAVNIDNKWVVEKTLPEDSVRPGDTILSVNGESMEKRIKRCRKYLSVSIDNRYWDAFANLLGSNTTKAKFEVLRNGKKIQCEATCVYIADAKADADVVDNESKLMRDGTVGYIREEGEGYEELDDVMEKFRDTKGIIVDLRYLQPPLIGTCLPQHLFSKPEKYFTVYAANRFVPGAFTETDGWPCGRGAAKKIFREIGERKNLMEILNYSNVTNNGIINTWKGKERKRPIYKGRVVVIIDERAMSKYELAALAIRKSPNSIIIGSGTVGANGAAAEITLPGELEALFTANVSKSYPGNKQLQRVGVKPDIEVKPTVKGLADGRDELVEKAVKLILDKKPFSKAK